MSNKRVLITGGSGLLGLNWAAEIDGLYEATLATHSKKLTVSFAQSRQLNLSDYDQLFNSIKELNPSILIHTAGLTNVEKCESNPKAAFESNVKTTENLAKICQLLGVKLVYVSTDHLFDGTRSLSTETAIPAPLNRYGTTKLAGERVALINCINTLVVRTNFFAWGPQYRPSFSDYIIKSLIQNDKIDLFTDAFFTPILANTLVCKVHQLLKLNTCGIVNIVGNDRVSKFEFGLLIANEFKLDKKLINESYLADRHDLVRRPFDMSLSNQLAQKLTMNRFPYLVEDIASLKSLQHSHNIMELREL